MHLLMVSLKLLPRKISMVKKHREALLSIISDVKMQSTRELQTKLSKKVGKVINWSDLYRSLKYLLDKNYIKLYETKAGFFWIKETN